MRPVRRPQLLGVLLNATGLLVQAATLLEIITQLVDDIGMDLAIFCDSLSAIGPPCEPFQPENFRAQLLSATL